MLTVQKAIIRKDDKFLCLLRSKIARVFPDMWDFPGGKLDPGESLEEGIRREVKEETTLEVHSLRQLTEFNLLVEGRPVNFIIYSVESFTGNVKICKEHQEFKWLEKEEVKKLKIEPFLKKLIKERII